MHHDPLSLTLVKVVLKATQITSSPRITNHDPLSRTLVKVLLKAIQRTYDKNPEIQEVIDMSMKEVRAEDGISSEQVFFYFCFFFVAVFIIMAILEKILKTRVLNTKNSLWKF